MDASELHSILITYAVAFRAFTILSMDSAPSYEEQILKENLLAYLAKLAHTQAQTIRNVQRTAKSDNKEVSGPLLQSFSADSASSATAAHALSTLKRELTGFLTRLLQGAADTLFYKFVNLSGIYREYRTLSGTDTANGKDHLSYAEFLTDLPNTVLTITNRLLIYRLHSCLLQFYRAKYPQEYYKNMCTTGTILSPDELRLLNQQYEQYVVELKERCVYCKTCRIETHTEIDMVAHLSGRRHRATLKRGSNTSTEHYDTFAALHKITVLITQLSKEISLATEYAALAEKMQNPTSGPAFLYCNEERITSYVDGLVTLAYRLATELSVQIGPGAHISLSFLLSKDDNGTSANKMLNRLAVKKKIVNPNTGEEILWWQYVAHGLNKRFLCEVCGEIFYYGQQVFDKHFHERQHIAGLEALGVSAERCKQFAGLATRTAVLNLKAVLCNSQSA